MSLSLWMVINEGVWLMDIYRAPTSGGQYHWVSEFAPPEYQQSLSYVVGWMSTLSWQAGNAADCFLTGTISQALIQTNSPSYEPKRWQGTLLVFAMVRLKLCLQSFDRTDSIPLGTRRLFLQYMGPWHLATRTECTHGAACTCILRYRSHTLVSCATPQP